MEFNNIKELIELINKSDIAYFEYTIDGAHLKMDKSLNRGELNHQQGSFGCIKEEEHVQVIEKVDKVTTLDRVVETNESFEVSGKEVKSPMVGTFYSSPSPEKSSFVEVGSKVKKGDILCIVEAMKLMNEIESEVDGEIVKILVNTGDMVEYGQPIFLIKED
ncbi:MAG: acetyl-CoA carboxylase biotin carboxyl carrier protein [Clostridium sp.]